MGRRLELLRPPDRQPSSRQRGDLPGESDRSCSPTRDRGAHAGAGEDARLAALAAGGAESLAVAGGDGSVAAVAGVAVECDLPLVVVPTGTLNHFARDLG